MQIHRDFTAEKPQIQWGQGHPDVGIQDYGLHPYHRTVWWVRRKEGEPIIAADVTIEFTKDGIKETRDFPEPDGLRPEEHKLRTYAILSCGMWAGKTIKENTKP